jgi:hypothetical protein
LVSDIPVGDGKIVNLFLQCRASRKDNIEEIHVVIPPNLFISFLVCLYLKISFLSLNPMTSKL